MREETTPAVVLRRLRDFNDQQERNEALFGDSRGAAYDGSIEDDLRRMASLAAEYEHELAATGVILKRRLS